MSSSEWNLFRKKMKGKGYTIQQLSQIYKGGNGKSPLKKAKTATKKSLKASLKSLPKTRKSKRKALKKEISKQGTGRGSRTRGWAAASPQRGRERKELYDKCGERCFLEPKKLGFPVCASLRENQGCKIDCRGVMSAKVRAAQWKHEGAYKEATRLQNQYSC
jgi:hypothetical protein